MAKLVLKICCEEWANQSRDKRELSVCREQGADVVVMAKGNTGDSLRRTTVDGFLVLLSSTRPLGERFPKILNQAIASLQWAFDAKNLHPDIISGHDLRALWTGWMSNVFRKEKATLIYDSHEFELERNVQRSWLKKRIIRSCEKFLIKRCAFSIMVNDSIANAVQREYQLKNRPLVVRNTPNLWMIDNEVCAKRRKEMLLQMDTPKDMILLYHGGLIKNRGIETLLKLVSINPHVCAVILGNGNAEYQLALRELAEEYHVTDRVLFHPAVPIEQLWEYVGAVDVGMVLLPAICKNHLYSLPNKFFENIQSETPVICAEYPAMTPIVQKYHIGLTCDPTDVEAVNRCVEKMRTDTTLYKQCKDNTKLAKQDLCWEKEKRTLLDAYQMLI